MDQHRLARIRLLSTRFHELQGLRIALAGAVIAVVFGSYLLVVREPTHSAGMIAILLSGLLMIPGEVWLHRYYAETFGRQVRQRPSKWWQPIALFAFFFIGTFVNNRFPEIPAGGPTAGFVAFASLIVAIRDWPWRAYYLGATASVATGLTIGVLGSDPINPGLTLTLTFFLFGLSLVPIGLSDHRLLVKLVQEAREATALSDPVACSPPDRG
jgi:hypothetical protein